MNTLLEVISSLKTMLYYLQIFEHDFHFNTNLRTLSNSNFKILVVQPRIKTRDYFINCTHNKTKGQKKRTRSFDFELCLTSLLT